METLAGFSPRSLQDLWDMPFGLLLRTRRLTKNGFTTSITAFGVMTKAREVMEGT
jgi:hypothetical protein